MSKKILSLALALVMLVSVFTVGASAAVADGKKLAFVVECNDELVAGKTVDVNVYVEIPATEDLTTYKLGQINYVLLYDNNVFDGPGKVDRTWNADMPWFNDAANVNSAPTLFNQFKAGYTEDDLAKYNAAVLVQTGTYVTGQTDAYGDEVKTKTGYGLAAHKTLMFTLKFTVKSTYAGGDTQIGIVEGPYNVKKTQVFAKTHYSTGGTPTAIPYTELDFSNATTTVKAPASYKVFDGAVKIRRNAVDSAKYDLGFTGSFKASDFAVAFNDKGTSTNLTKVGVKVTMNGVTNEYTDRFVYETADGYQFRAVLAGLEDRMADMEISVVMFIEFDGVRYESAGLTTTLGAHTGRLPA